MNQEFEKELKKGKRFEEDYMEGTKYILPQKHKDWLKFVQVCYNDIFEGQEVKSIIKVLRLLKEEQDFNEINSYVDKTFDSGSIYARAMRATVKFGYKGPEFYEYACKNFDDETRAVLNKQKQENREYEKQLVYGEPVDSLCKEY